MVIKRVGVLSVGKVWGCLFLLLGLIIGALLTLLSLVGVAAGRADTGLFALLTGVCAIVIVPVLYGVIGFLGGIFTAALYNVVASFIGGIEIELKKKLDDYA